MGWTLHEVRVTARLSSHNSEQDVKDRADWEEFVERITAIAREHRYEDLSLDVIE